MSSTHIDPVCGMTVTPEGAAAQSEYKRELYYFCAPGCKARFDADPEAYLKADPASRPVSVPVVQLGGLKMSRAPLNRHDHPIHPIHHPVRLIWRSPA